MATLSLSLVSHTNVGKTTLARTLLGRDIGEVRDAPHVTEVADAHLLVESSAGDRLSLWATPGGGASVRLEVDPSEINRLLENREAILGFFKNLGFKYVVADLEGYRQGSLNEWAPLCA
jgi:hypothetical protein